VSCQLPITTHHPPLTTHNLPFTVYLFTFSCKTNPICTNHEYTLTSCLAEIYGKNDDFSPAKANPNEPKQSQSHPHFSPVIAPKSQNKPKQTQFSKKPQNTTQLLYSQTLTTRIPNSPQPNPTCRGEACSPRQRAGRSRAGQAATKPVSNASLLGCIWRSVRQRPARRQWHGLGGRRICPDTPYF